MKGNLNFFGRVDFLGWLSSSASALSIVEPFEFVDLYKKVISNLVSYSNVFSDYYIDSISSEVDYSITFLLKSKNSNDVVIKVPASKGKSYPKDYVEKIELSSGDFNYTGHLLELEFAMNLAKSNFEKKETLTNLKLVCA